MAVNQIGALITFTNGTEAEAPDVNSNFTDTKTAFNNLVTGLNTINIDTINEVTATNGVSIDSVVCKDGGVTLGATGQITSVIVTGTAPFVVASTTLVANLNVDLLDGQHGSFYQDAANMNAGVLADARVQASNVTQHQAALTITVGQISGTVAVTQGGTGLVSPTSGNLLVGAGASAMTALAPGAAAGFVRSNGSAWVRSAIAASDVASGTFADGRIAASNVTQHQAALTILETQITDGAVLARVAGNETISGTWNFTAATVGINHGAHGNMLHGLVIDQGTTDSGELNFALKSSTFVNHGLTTGVSGHDIEVDDAFTFNTSASGGVEFAVIAEASGGSNSICIWDIYPGEYDTAPFTATGTTGAFTIIVQDNAGSNTIGDVPANAAIFSVRARVGGVVRTLQIVDAEGDIHVDGSTSLTAFDAYDDAALLRTLQRVTAAPGQIIDTAFDKFVTYGRQTLEKAGIIGPGPDGMWNMTKCQRLLVGNAWQQETKIRQLRGENDRLSARLVRLESIVDRLLTAGA